MPGTVQCSKPLFYGSFLTCQPLLWPFSVLHFMWSIKSRYMHLPYISLHMKLLYSILPLYCIQGFFQDLGRGGAKQHYVIQWGDHSSLHIPHAQNLEMPPPPTPPERNPGIYVTYIVYATSLHELLVNDILRLPIISYACLF